MAWLKERGKSHSDPLTLGDLLDLGFDPTRLKEIAFDGQEFIFERLQERQLSDLKKKSKLLSRIASEMSLAKVRSASLKTNAVLLVIRDRGNAYVLRRKISAIHWEEAIDQLQTRPLLRNLNPDVKADRILLTTVRAAAEMIEDRLGLDKGTVEGQLTPFVPWDLENNHPKLVIDFEGTYLESLWMA